MPAVNILAGLLLLLTLCSTQTAPAPALAPGPVTYLTSVKCLQSVGNATDCFSYITVGSKPESTCCSELAGLIQNAPECACHLLGSGQSPHFGVTFDKQRGVNLTSICGVNAPPPSSCLDMDFPTYRGEDSSGSQGKKTGGMTTKD